jgi:hypothetical protein
MAICLYCQKEYYVWKNDKDTIFQLFCCEECAKAHDKELKDQDWPRDPALKYKVPVGEIACPRCGTVQHGVLNPICPHCDKLYWSEEEYDEDNNPYFYEQGEPNEKDRN